MLLFLLHVFESSTLKSVGGKRSWHSRRMRNAQFYVSGKRPMTSSWVSQSPYFFHNSARRIPRDIHSSGGWMYRDMCRHFDKDPLNIRWSLENKNTSRMNTEVTMKALERRHNERYGVSNYRRLECLLNRFSGAGQRKRQSSASLAFVRGIHWWPVTPHKGLVTRKIFPFDDVTMASKWISEYHKHVSNRSKRFDCQWDSTVNEWSPITTCINFNRT